MKNQGLFTKKLLFFVIATVGIGSIPFPMKAQMVLAGDGTIVHSPPQSMNFMKYGNTPVNLFTGTLSMNIPIYTYKDKDFELPISIGYASTGFTPNVPTGQLGIGWFLNAGGCISREVKGVPDDASQEEPISSLISQFQVGLKGYYYMHEIHDPDTSRLTFNTHYKYSAFLIRNLIDSTTADDREYVEYFETRSDVYTFNFGPHKGTFMLGPRQKVHVFNSNRPYGEYKIEFLPIDSMGFEGMVITTGDGYKYTFGGVPELAMHSRPQTVTEALDGYIGMVNNNYKTSWPITQIEAPNGRKITFQYDSSIPDSCFYGAYPTPAEYSMMPFKEDIENNYDYFQTSGFKKFTPNPQYIKESRLICIDIDGRVKIDFSYGSKQMELVQNFAQPELKNRGRLESITVRKMGDSNPDAILKECKFTYRYSHPSGNPMLFLKNVHLSGEGGYAMDYFNEDDIFPFHGTTEVDLWGYYNEGLNNGAMYNGHPDMQSARYGMLKKITYPTKGYSRFEYELHDCSHTVARWLSNTRYPYISPCEITILGGLRIKKIIDYSSAQDSTSREFIYKTNGKSSGTSMSFPRYIMYPDDPLPLSLEDPKKPWLDKYWNISDIKKEIFGSTPFYTDVYSFLYCPDKTHIEYNYVTEKRSDSSRIIYHYCSPVEMPDINIIDGALNREKENIYDNEEHPENYLDERNPISRHTQRGKLLSKDIFDDKDNLVYREEHHYDTTKFLKCLYGIGVSKSYYYKQGTYVSDYPLDKIVRTTYQGQDSIVSENRYRYNDLGQIVRSETTDSKGATHIVKNRFVSDTPHDRFSIEEKLIDRNMLQYPLQSADCLLQPGGSEKVLKSIRHHWKEFGNPAILKPSRIEQTSLLSPLDSLASEIISNWETARTFDYYDQYGNILQTTDKDGKVTCYIWGYNGLYPVAVIENFALPFLLPLSPKCMDSDYHSILTGGLTYEQEYQLRHIPGTKVTTYEYRVPVGMIRKTDPSNRSVYYDYDEHGRLKTVSDTQKNVSETYDYHFKQ